MVAALFWLTGIVGLRGGAPRCCGLAVAGGYTALPVEIQAPFDAYRDRVRPEWTDHNRHLNVGYYVLVFDYATDEFLDYVGLTTAHREAQQVSTFCLEGHIIYQREVREGAPLRFTTQLLAFDEKRIHYIHKMYHQDEGYLAATNELMSLHVSQSTRRRLWGFIRGLRRAPRDRGLDYRGSRGFPGRRKHGKQPPYRRYGRVFLGRHGVRIPSSG